MDKAHLRWLHRGTGVGTARVRYRLTGTNDRFWPILLKNPVFRGAQKIAGPERLRCISDVGGDPT